MLETVIYADRLEDGLLPLISDYTSVFILADTHTAELCLPLLPVSLRNRSELIIVEAGEKSKNLESCAFIWEKLSAKKADRHSLLLNLGGGMVTDLGGFTASCYKRGIDFIHLPTSLLAMVDAAVGGKTGINFLGYKNQVGSFSAAKAVVIHTDFLKTLPYAELRSAFAEVLKYGIIADKELWEKTGTLPAEIPAWESIIRRCISIKQSITAEDPLESGRRKILNFGHTIGHALESFYFGKEKSLLHGEAVAYGMMAESILSYRRKMLPEADLEEIIERIGSIFPALAIAEKDYPVLLGLMYQDKKNRGGGIRFVMPERIGKTVFDIPCTEEEIIASLQELSASWNS